MIMDPVTLHAQATVGETRRLMTEYRIGGIPVVDAQSKLMGIVTNRDLRFETNDSRLVEEIMTKENVITGQENTTLEEAEVILQKNKIEKLPIVKKDGTLVGLIT